MRTVHPEQQWLIIMIATASIILLALFFFVLLCQKWRVDDDDKVECRIEEQIGPTTPSPPIVVIETDTLGIDLEDGMEVSNMTCTDYDDESGTTSTTTNDFWLPVEQTRKTSLRCPKLDYANPKFEEASMGTPLPSYLQLNVSGVLRSTSMGDSSIVRNMKAALAGLRGEPSSEATEI